MSVCPACGMYCRDTEIKCGFCGAALSGAAPRPASSLEKVAGQVLGSMGGMRLSAPPAEGEKRGAFASPEGLRGRGGVVFQPEKPEEKELTPLVETRELPSGLMGKMGAKMTRGPVVGTPPAASREPDRPPVKKEEKKSELALLREMGRMGGIVFRSPNDEGPVETDDGTNEFLSHIPDAILYQRSPRLRIPVPEMQVEIEAPPTIGDKPEINWLSTLMPVLISVAVAVVMMLVMDSPMMMLFSIPMAVSGLVVSLVNYRKQKKKYREQTETRLNVYTNHLRESVERIEFGQQRQLDALSFSDPDTMQCFRIVEECDRTLWDRSPSDSDFCSLRIGSGTLPSSVSVKTPRVGLTLVDDELRDRPEAIRRLHENIYGAPIVCDIRANRICGVVGPRADAIALLRNMLVQFATHQCYTEARLICIYDECDGTTLSWVGDLPHALDEERENALVATNREDAKRILTALAEVLKDRKLELESDNSYSAPPMMLPYFLIVVAQPAFLTKDNPINEYLLRGPDLGAGMIMAVEDITQLPKECNLIITARDGAGEIFSKADTTHRRPYIMDELRSISLIRFSRKLRRIVCEEVGKKAPLPKKYDFYQMQGISAARDWDVSAHWRASDICAGISAPIGIAEGNELLNLDLHENAHGPHGLVAGTTGSGKSEVMLSYLLSLAMRYHPYELGFVIIDFKGGGMANRLAELPHLIGAITNIEGGAINRSLASIKAELLKRQRLFAEAGVDSIDKYIRALKTGRARVPLPHLVIIVDEFAELKAQQPEFMAELISAARIGRSLGIHLILATQKPAGQVSDQIWSNSRFQICLKVATKEDSNDVIKSPLALSIKEPGRAYLRVGNNEVFELFQSGYSGGKAPDARGTQLEAMVAHIAESCRASGIVRLPPICLPELPERIDYPARIPARSPQLPVGIFDDPEGQCQGPQMLDVFGKNTFILGSSLSGKTNLLQTIIRGAAESYSPEEMNIYVLDFASMVLKNYETLPHVGGVVTRLEDEKLKNLMRLLNAEIESRRNAFLELGVSSFNAYLEAGRRDKARILLLIDNLTALRELYFQDDDALLPLCQSGLTYGISVVATNSQTAGIGYKYLANFANRIAMFCNDSGEYASFFEHCSLRIPDIHGRCIVEQSKRLLQCHTYLAFPGEREVDRAEAIRSWAAQIGRRSSSRARAIPQVPEKLPSQALIRASAPGMRKRGGCVVGLDYETVTPVLLELDRLGVLGVAGGDGIEARGLIRHLIRTAETVFPESMSFYIVDGIGRGLLDCGKRPLVAAYEYLPAKAPELIKTVEAELARRYDALMHADADPAQEKLLVLVLTGNAAIEAASADASALAAFRNIVGKFKSLKACVLLNECDNSPINYAAPELLKKLKEEQKLIFFGDLAALKLFDLPYTSIKKFKKPLGRNDAYLIQGSDCVRMKVPEDEAFSD